LHLRSRPFANARPFRADDEYARWRRLELVNVFPVKVGPEDGETGKSVDHFPKFPLAEIDA
jgi:hypothetical protein